jgi:hypothetical protein
VRKPDQRDQARGMSWKDGILRHKGDVREWNIRMCLRIMAVEGEWIELEHRHDFLIDLVQEGVIKMDDSADNLTPDMFGDDHAS